jgi:hypothetical protein
MLDSAASSTAPITTAPGAIKAVSCEMNFTSGSKNFFNEVGLINQRGYGVGADFCV